MSWTKQQKKVIDLRGANLLVSAAAGSGKTAVLVERILQKITDPVHPVDIDRILVVTFTKAAASEMRERIADTLSARLDENPQDANLQRQSSLLPNAKISTIDSFCRSVIRNQFFRIGLEPSFRVGDEGEMKVMQEDVLERLLEERYETMEDDPAFARFVGHFAGDRSDKKLKNLVLQVYDYAMSEPWPAQYLTRCRQMYRLGDGDAWLSTDWMRQVTDFLRAQISGIAASYEELIRLSLSPGGPYMYEETLRADLRQILPAVQAEDFRSMQEILQGFTKDRLKSCRDRSVDAGLKEAVQSGRSTLADRVVKLRKTYFSQSPEMLRAQMAAAAGDIDVLCDLTTSFMDAFSERKRSENVLDFSDLEHDALRILVDERTQQPTAAAQEYRDYFDEIMIDEYQDSNYVQELLLMSISRQDDVHPNVFMVGDVKQSIYGFRLARPDLFMEKYRTYPDVTPEEDADDAEMVQPADRSVRIVLGKNFRSRPSVLEGVNAVFARLMREDVGGISYGPAEALYPGGIYPQSDPDTYRMELLLTDKGIEAETALITQRIRQMTDPVDPLLITDKGADAPRPVRYHDIVILMRSLGEKADRMAQQLTDAGIPAHVQSKTGYFSSPEIRTVLAFLQIIDNPRQDIPLAAVLKSPIYGADGDALAQIRAQSRDTDFYDAVVHYAAEGPSAQLRQTLERFLSDLQDYRAQSRMLQMHELLSYLLRRSGYDKIVSAMPGGTQRLMNLRMLEERAAAFEQTSFHGLYEFNRYIEQLRSYQVDYGEASAVGEADDAVRIISIHKSKGLEYPVVFVAALGNKFNKKDLSKDVQLHAQCGIGIDAFNDEKRTKTPTILKKAIRMMNETEQMGEEMRVLYVAMTRAREKLILTAASDRSADMAQQMQQTVSAPLSFYERMQAGCFLDWIKDALAGRTDVCDIRYLSAEALSEADARQIFSRRALLPFLRQQAAQADPALTEALQAQFALVQVPEDLPAKVSVSELKLDRIRELGEDPEELFAQTHRKSYVPAFARAAEDADGASYGTAVHRVMECLDFAACAARMARTGDAAAALEEQLDAMAAAGEISREIYEIISRRALTAFLESGLFARMAAADGKGLLSKERPFVMGISAAEVKAEYPASETVLVQGIIDAYFEEDGRIVLVDYKTDRIKRPQELTDRYRRQMELYAQALESGTGRPVSEMLLYSFALDRVCPVTEEG